MKIWGGVPGAALGPCGLRLPRAIVFCPFGAVEFGSLCSRVDNARCPRGRGRRRDQRESTGIGACTEAAKLGAII